MEENIITWNLKNELSVTRYESEDLCRSGLKGHADYFSFNLKSEDNTKIDIIRHMFEKTILFSPRNTI